MRKIVHMLISLTLFLLVMYSFVDLFAPTDASGNAHTSSEQVNSVEHAGQSFQEKDSAPAVYTVGHAQGASLSDIQAKKQEKHRDNWPAIQQLIEEEDAYIRQRSNWKRIINNALVEGYDERYDREWDLDLYR